MEITDRVRLLCETKPFKPFAILTSGGTRYLVRQGFQLNVSPDGKVLTYRYDDGSTTSIAAKLVQEILVQSALSEDGLKSLQRIRLFRDAQPFRAFSVILNGGRVLRVGQPYELGIAPHGRHLIHAGPPLGWEQIPTDHVCDVVVENGDAAGG